MVHVGKYTDIPYIDPMGDEVLIPPKTTDSQLPKLRHSWAMAFWRLLVILRSGWFWQTMGDVGHGLFRATVCFSDLCSRSTCNCSPCFQ